MVSEETREKDERLREELRHVDLEKLKKVIKPLIATPDGVKRPGRASIEKKAPK
jgi:hypothetical protein